MNGSAHPQHLPQSQDHLMALATTWWKPRTSLNVVVVSARTNAFPRCTSEYQSVQRSRPSSPWQSPYRWQAMSRFQPSEGAVLIPVHHACSFRYVVAVKSPVLAKARDRHYRRARIRRHYPHTLRLLFVCEI